jgi:glutamate-5-semialdehyde dehydrogenase
MNKTQLEQMGACAVNAAKSLQTATAQQKNIFFEEAIKLIQKNTNEILDANLQDINDAHSKNKDDAFIDRLRLDNARIDGICDALNEIQTFPDPVGKTLASWKRPNGLQIDRVSTPLGVIGIIFESRPNVASDASALCIKSGNAVILRSGSDGLRTSKAIVLQIQNALKNAELPKFAVQIVDSTERAAVDLMLGGLGNTIDVIVPRGGKSLVEAVERSAKVPVFGHLE